MRTNATNTPEGGPAVPRIPLRIVCILAVGACLSGVGFLAMRGWEDRATERRAADLARAEVDKLRIQILRSIEILHSVAALHAATGTLDHDSFHRFVRSSLARQTGLRAVSWNPRIPEHDEHDLQDLARLSGTPGFRIVSRNQLGEFVPAPSGQDHVPVLFIEPMDGNRLAVGFDLNSDSARRSSLEGARDSGEPTITAPIRLAQEPGDGVGFLVVLPVYHGSRPASVPRRREQLAGFAVAVFGAVDVARPLVDALAGHGLPAAIRDASIAGPILCEGPATTSPTTAKSTPPNRRVSSVPVDLPGRQWMLTYDVDPEVFAGHSHAQSWMTLGGGLTFTLLATVYLLGDLRSARRVAEANRALAAEVRTRHRAESEAAAANAAKSDFLANMSHEIRTPLNAILGYTQLLRRDAGLSAEQRDTICGIASSGEHLLGLINEILDLSKIEAGRMEAHVEDFDLPALARQLEATFRPLCSQKRIGFHIDLPLAATPRVRGDEGKLRQILINLLGNAVKFTDAGEVRLRCTPADPGRWHFEVIDTGMGIPEDELRQIFQPFHQGSGARHHGGTGLGLAIASRQVELLGGRLEVDSLRGVGSRFHFTLPLAPALTAAPTRPPDFLRITAPRPIEVLVIDDHPANRDVLGGLLSRIGCTVRVAANAEEARLAIADRRPDIAFLDLILPGPSGPALARELLGRAPSPPFPVVAHSASTCPRLRAEAQAAGCVRFLPKPFTPEELRDCLASLLPVGFEFAPAADDPASRREPCAAQLERVVLPDELHARLAVAAELHSTTALKACLADMRELGPEAAALADAIRELLRAYDMHGVLRLLARVPSRSGSASPARREDAALPVASA